MIISIDLHLVQINSRDARLTSYLKCMVVYGMGPLENKGSLEETTDRKTQLRKASHLVERHRANCGQRVDAMAVYLLVRVDV